MIQEVKKGDKIKAETINALIAQSNKTLEMGGLFGNGENNGTIPPAISGEYVDYPNMWSCKDNDCDGNFIIRGGYVVLLYTAPDTKVSEESIFKVNDTNIAVSSPCKLYVNVTLNDDKSSIVNALLTTEKNNDYSETYKSIEVGEFFKNENQILFYRQYNKAQLQINSINLDSVLGTDKISFLGIDGIDINDVTYGNTRVVEIIADFSFIAGDGITIQDNMIGTNRAVIIKADSPIPQDYISFCSGDNITINEYSLTGGRRVEISASIPSVLVPDYSFVGDDRIQVTDTAYNNGKTRVIKLGFSFLDGDLYDFDPEFFIVEEGTVTFNTVALNDLILEAVDDIEVEVEANGVYRNVSGHGDLYYNTATTDSDVNSLSVDSEISYNSPS